MNIVIILALLFIFYFIYKRYKKLKIQEKENYINFYIFPKRLNETLKSTYPHLNQNQIDLVIKGLREYFHICNIAGDRMIAMPSQVVDIAWHDFILFTRKYEKFCEKGLGRFLHHTPAEAMKSKTVAQEGIKRAWTISCHRENIIPKLPGKLPLLFALDSLLEIPDGFKYSLDCLTKNSADYCAGHIGVTSGCGSGCSGDFGNDGGSGDGGSCGGG